MQPLEVSGQGKQCERPDTLANVPAAQHAHSTWPTRAVALPRPQGAQPVLPTAEKNPAEHTVSESTALKEEGNDAARRVRRV